MRPSVQGLALSFEGLGFSIFSFSCLLLDDIYSFPFLGGCFGPGP